MSMTYDISAVARDLDRILANPPIHKLAIVLPLSIGKGGRAFMGSLYRD